MKKKEKCRDIGQMETLDLLKKVIKFRKLDERDEDRLKNIFSVYNTGTLNMQNIISDIEDYTAAGELEKLRMFSELHTRLFGSNKKLSITKPEDVMKHVYSLSDNITERMVAFFMNVKNEIVSKETIAIGGYNSVLCQPGDIFIPALKNNARNIILVHNHPSGDTQPSQEDISFTQKVNKAAGIVGLNLLDHLIVTNEDFYSFKKNGLL